MMHGQQNVKRGGNISEVTIGVSDLFPAKCNDEFAFWLLLSREKFRNCNFFSFVLAVYPPVSL